MFVCVRMCVCTYVCVCVCVCVCVKLGDMAIHCAAWSGSLDVVQYLMSEAGVDKNVRGGVSSMFVCVCMYVCMMCVRVRVCVRVCVSWIYLRVKVDKNVCRVVSS